MELQVILNGQEVKERLAVEVTTALTVIPSTAEILLPNSLANVVGAEVQINRINDDGTVKIFDGYVRNYERIRVASSQGYNVRLTCASRCVDLVLTQFFGETAEEISSDSATLDTVIGLMLGRFVNGDRGSFSTQYLTEATKNAAQSTPAPSIEDGQQPSQGNRAFDWLLNYCEVSGFTLTDNENGEPTLYVSTSAPNSGELSEGDAEESRLFIDNSDIYSRYIGVSAGDEGNESPYADIPVTLGRGRKRTRVFSFQNLEVGDADDNLTGETLNTRQQYNLFAATLRAQRRNDASRHLIELDYPTLMSLKKGNIYRVNLEQGVVETDVEWVASEIHWSWRQRRGSNTRILLSNASSYKLPTTAEQLEQAALIGSDSFRGV